MREADRVFCVQQYVDIARSPDDVFPWLLDPERVTQWMPNMVENEHVRASGTVVGTEIRQVFRFRGRRVETLGRITEYIPTRLLGFRIHGRACDLDVSYDLKPIDGHTRVTQSVSVNANMVLVMLATIGKPIIRWKISRNIGRLKAACEQSCPDVRDHGWPTQ